MMKFEYKILQTQHPTANAEQLTNLGAEGWELCSIVEWQTLWYYYFKRQEIIK